MMMLMMIGIIVVTMRLGPVTRVKMTGVMTRTIILQIFNLRLRNCLRCTVAAARPRAGPRHHLPEINLHHHRVIKPLVPVTETR